MNVRKFWKVWEKWGIFFLIVIVSALFSSLTRYFLSISNFRNFINQAAIVAITGAGMTLAITSGGFDLSVGSILALCSCVAAKMVLHHGIISLAVAGSLIVGAVLGVFNGLIITKLRVPAFIATLGMMTVVRGAALIYTAGRDILIMKETAFKLLSGGRILTVPVPIIIMSSFFLLTYVALMHSPFGRHICAVGSNEEAACTSGLNVDRIKIVVFAIVGASAALSGLIMTSQTLVANGTMGVGFELQTISIVVLGGTSLTGGRGNLFGTMMGAILIAVVNNGLNLLNTPPFYQYLTLGLLLLLALTIDGLRRKLTGGIFLKV